VRICIDPRELNKALLREHYTLSILEEIRQSPVFSLADLSSEYWHMALDKVTTFQTLFGRYRWCGLPVGTCGSAEIFQKKLIGVLEGFPGVTSIADDVLIHGNTTDDDDKNMELFFKRCQETGIKLNKSKLE